jgi:hypothetical protein
MERVKLVVLIPVGPAEKLEYVRDTIESILYFTTPSRKIIVSDNTGQDSCEQLKHLFRDITVLKTPQNYGKGKYGELYINLSMGLEFMHRNYDFDVLLGMDADALIIGPNPEEEAIDFFCHNQEFGIIGSYRIDCNGVQRDFTWPREQLRRETGLFSLLRQPRHLRGVMFLRKIVRKSKKNGYELGEHCMGGAYFASRQCISRLYQHNLLSRREIDWSRLSVDHIFGLFIYAVGLKHGDFSTGRLPMGLRWRGLPCSPEELLVKGKKVTHSTRSYGAMSEAEIRRFFRAQRQKENAHNKAMNSVLKAHEV